MIMKRKLPSQTEKLDEELLEGDKKTEAEQKEQTSHQETSPQGEASGASDRENQSEEANQGADEEANEGAEAEPEAESSPEAHTQESPEPTSEPEPEPEIEPKEEPVSQPPASAGEARKETFDAPADNNPGEIPDPFVHGDDEDDMTLAAPPQRPGDDIQTGTGVPPRQHKVSTEALLGGEEAREKTPTAPEPVHEKPAAEKQASESGGEDLGDLFPDGKDSPVTPEDSKSDDDTWDLGDLVDVPEESSTIGGSPFGGDTDRPEANPKQQEGAPPPEAEKLPPWKRKRTGDNGDSGFTPKLPQVARKAPSKVGALVSLGLVVLLIGGTAMFYQNRDTAVETISRWTGTLNEVGQPVPTQPQQNGGGSQQAADTQQPDGTRLQAESVVRQDQMNGTGQQPALANQMAGNGNGVAQESEESGIAMEVLDVPPEEAKQPIVGDESVEMPEDVDKFTALQQAIAEKRAERRKETSARLEDEEDTTDPEDLSPEEITRRNLEIIRQTNASLAEYRKALAEVDDPALKPRPGKFLRGEYNGNQGTLPPPDSDGQQTRQQTTRQQQQQPKLYGNKVVSDLSELVAEKQEKETGVRTLQDFDVSVFEPNRPRVSIPKGITPRLSKEDFPKLEVFSFVPGQGIIGKTRGQEGVLLLGETLEGWELVDVYSNYAEFQKNGKKRIVTLTDANR